MIRKILMGSVAAAVAVGGLVALGGSASAAKPTVTAATAANISCTITAKAKLSPALKNNWDQQAHEAADGETNTAVQALPDTQFSAGLPVSTSAKAKTGSCTGTVTDGTGTYPVTSLGINLTAGTPAVDNPPVAEPGTCTGLLAGTGVGDVAATYNTDIKVKLGGAKMTNITVSGSTIAPSGVGFAIANGTTGGSIVGGNSKSQAYIDGITLGAVSAAPATSLAPIPTSVICEASLQLKVKKGVDTAKLKKPKGLKKIVIGPNLLPPNDASNICIRKGSTCP